MNNLPDYENRRVAVTTFDKNIVVTAGAGTGKTTLLVDRIVCLLMRRQDPLKITDIVALTFTNKAASEMRVRLRKKLEGIVCHGAGVKGEDSEESRMLREIIEEFELSDSEIRVRAQDALDELEKAQICTMHSFAGFILRFYPLEAGIDPGFREDDGTAFKEHFEKEWEDWLDIELSLSSTHRELWEAILNKTTIESLKDFVSELCNESIPLGSLVSSLENPHEPGVTKENENPLELWIRSHQLKVKELLTKYIKSRKIEKLLFKAGEVFENIIADRTPEILPKILDDDSCTMPTDWDEEDFAEAKRIIKAAKRLSSADDTFFHNLSELCLPFIKRCRARFTAKGYISFDGLLSFSREILKNREDVREGLKRRFKAILVDEFQDTDPVQYEIILYMSELSGRHETEWRKVKLTPGKLFIVGDPKQSIYAFRKADIEAYSDVSEMVLAENSGRKTDLSTNFRSNNRIIDVVNDVFSCLIKKRGLYQPEYVNLINRPDKEAKLPDQRVELRLTDARNMDDVNAPKAVRLEAEAIGRWIKEEAIGKKEINGPDGKKVVISPGHIAILLRKLTDVYEYLEVLRKYDIPYTVEGERHFYKTQEVIDFVNLLRVIDNPGDTLAMAGVLRSPLGGLSDREVYELNRLLLLDYRTTVNFKEKLKGIEELKKLNVNSLSKLYELLFRLKKDVAAKPVPDAIHCIFETLPVLEFAASSYNGEQALANLIKIQKIAEFHCNRADLTLKGFTALLEENVTEVQEEGESLLAEEAVNAVRIMSIHKAKGLEFPVVILAGVHTSKNEREDDVSVIHDWSTDTTGFKLDNLRNRVSVMIYDKNKIKDEEEQKRLLYVAMTRAREMLIISGTLYGSLNKNCFMSMIQEVTGDIAGDKSSDLIELGRGIINQCLIKPDVIRKNKNKKITRQAKSGCMVGHDKVVELKGLWEVRMRRFNNTVGRGIFTSPTKIEKTRQYFTGSEKQGERRPEIAVITGNAVHYLLEHWDFKNDKLLMNDITIDEVISSFLLQQRGLEMPSVQDEIKCLMGTFLLSPAYNELKKSEILGREVPFTMSWEGQVMEGFIDIIFKIGDSVYVADYKTDMVSAKDMEDMEDKKKEYTMAGNIYMEAVRRCFGINAAGFKLIFLRAGEIF